MFSATDTANCQAFFFINQYFLAVFSVHKTHYGFLEFLLIKVAKAVASLEMLPSR